MGGRLWLCVGGCVVELNPLAAFSNALTGCSATASVGTPLRTAIPSLPPGYTGYRFYLVAESIDTSQAHGHVSGPPTYRLVHLPC